MSVSGDSGKWLEIFGIVMLMSLILECWGNWFDGDGCEGVVVVVIMKVGVMKWVFCDNGCERSGCNCSSVSFESCCEWVG